jgi:hypothetical protein
LYTFIPIKNSQLLLSHKKKQKERHRSDREWGVCVCVFFKKKKGMWVGIKHSLTKISNLILSSEPFFLLLLFFFTYINYNSNNTYMKLLILLTIIGSIAGAVIDEVSLF